MAMEAEHCSQGYVYWHSALRIFLSLSDVVFYVRDLEQRNESCLQIGETNHPPTVFNLTYQFLEMKWYYFTIA